MAAHGVSYNFVAGLNSMWFTFAVLYVEDTCPKSKRRQDLTADEVKVVQSCDEHQHFSASKRS